MTKDRWRNSSKKKYKH